MSRRPGAGWWGVVPALAIGGAAVAAVRLAGPAIYCGNGYFNIRFAEVLRHQGISRTFPWFQEAIHRDTYANFNLLYHLFLIPFTYGDLLKGAQLAGIVGGALAVGAFWVTLKMLRVPFPLLWTVLLLGAAPDLLYRLTYTRALVLGLGLTWLATGAVLTGRRYLAAIFGFLFPYLHVSWHLLPAMAVAHDLLRTTAPEETGWRRLRTTGWTCLGVALGLLVNPFFPNNLRFWAVANFGVLAAQWSRLDPPLYASEMAPLRSDQFLQANLGAFAVTALAALLLTWVRKVSGEARTLLVLALGFLALSLQSHRFAEQWAPFAVLLLAVLVRDAVAEGSWPRAISRKLAAGAALLAAVGLLGLAVREDRAAAATENVVDYAAASAWMEAHVPQGDTLFHPGYDEFDVLFFHDPRRRFLFGIDPGFFLAADRERYALWSRLVHGEMPDAWEAIRRTFRCRWVFLPARYVSLRRLLDRDPRFVPRYRDPDCGIYEVADDRGFVGNWRLFGPYPDAGRRWIDDPPDSEGQAVDLHAVSGYLDLRQLLAVPPGVRDVCAVAETRLESPMGTPLEVEMTTDDAVRLTWSAGRGVVRTPYLEPPFDLGKLGPGPPGPEGITARGTAVATQTPVRIAICQVGSDFGFVLLLRASTRTNPTP
jgi:hypothetical protein